MTAPQRKQVLEQLAVRNGMQRFNYFVGRTRALNRLMGVVSQEQTTAGWIHGPRRGGKSSLARNLASEAQQQGSTVVYLDASDLVPTDFDGLLERVLARIPPELRPSGSAPVRQRFEMLAGRSADNSILLVFDEFDQIALNLGTDEQALLRRLKEEHKRFCYLFATRLKPSLIVEEVSDERSRLLGVCTPEKLGMMERRDVHELCKRVGRDLGSASFERWHEPIWRAVGGLGAAVMALTHALAVEQLEVEGELDAAQVEDVLEQRREDVNGFLSGFWRDLQPGTREFLLEAGPAVSNEHRSSAKQEGFIDAAGSVIRPAWLIEVSNRLGRIPPEMQVGEGPNRVAKTERLHMLMAALNSNIKRLGYVQMFLHTDESLHYYPLNRPVRDQAGLKAAVDHLFKVLCEGARNSAGTWRIPEPLLTEFKASAPYKELVALRHFYDHDPDQRDDAERPSERYQNQGEVFRRHCGQPNPDHSDQWERVRDGLVDGLVDLLARLEVRSRDLPASPTRR
ncbi:ATP-binding protein [Archangium gephyra]|uniref:AAA family ATPase n=1 Tax=Archangium gephyra TaxID=48 RepID=UPI0035D4B9F1